LTSSIATLITLKSVNPFRTMSKCGRKAISGLLKDFGVTEDRIEVIVEKLSLTEKYYEETSRGTTLSDVISSNYTLVSGILLQAENGLIVALTQFIQIVAVIVVIVSLLIYFLSSSFALVLIAAAFGVGLLLSAFFFLRSQIKRVVATLTSDIERQLSHVSNQLEQTENGLLRAMCYFSTLK